MTKLNCVAMPSLVSKAEAVDESAALRVSPLRRGVPNVRDRIHDLCWKLLIALSSILLAACAGSATRVADQPCELHFEVTPHYDVAPRSLDIKLTFPSDGRSGTYLRLTPSWAGVEDFSNYLFDWHGVSRDAQVERTELPYRIRVAHPTSGPISVSFKARGDLADPDDGKPQDNLQQYRTQIGADWFQFFGYGVFPSVERYGDDRRVNMCITFQQDGTIATPLFGSYLPGHGNDVTRHLKGSPSLLRHAFYAGGSGWRVTERHLASGAVGVAMRGRFGVEDDAFVNKASAVIDAERRFWKEESAQTQWVVIAPNHSQYNSGGTLVNGAAILFGNKTFTPQNATFESLIGHENLHHWIPQRLGAHGGDPTSYWLSEGFTDYYTHRLLLSSGAWTVQQYADAVSSQLQRYWRSPARNATAQSIAPRFFSDQDAGKQMYSRGEILAASWDAALRVKGHAGLDEIVRSLLLPEGHELAETASSRVLDALVPVLGDQPRKDVENFVVEGRTIPLDAALFGPCVALARTDVPRWTLGFDPTSIGARKAIGVVLGGPAEKAGLREGAKIVGWSIFFGDVEKDVSLTTAVGSNMTTITYRPVDGSRDSLPTVKVVANADTDDLCNRWIRQPP